jgi:hypothetical protein
MKLDAQSVRRHSIMLDYIRQVAICKSVQETIRQALAHSDEVVAANEMKIDLQIG